MVNYERKQIRAPMESVDICHSTLGTALLRIQSLITRYGKDANIDMHMVPGNGGRDVLFVFSKRDETDEEMDRRIRWEQKCEEVALEPDQREARRLAFKKLERLANIKQDPSGEDNNG